MDEVDERVPQYLVGPQYIVDLGPPQGRSQDLVSGGGHPFRGGPTPYFSSQTPNHKGPPLCTFGYLRISGGPAPPPPPPWLRPWSPQYFVGSSGT